MRIYRGILTWVGIQTTGANFIFRWFPKATAPPATEKSLMEFLLVSLTTAAFFHPSGCVVGEQPVLRSHPDGPAGAGEGQAVDPLPHAHPLPHAPTFVEGEVASVHRPQPVSPRLGELEALGVAERPAGPDLGHQLEVLVGRVDVDEVMSSLQAVNDAMEVCSFRAFWQPILQHVPYQGDVALVHRAHPDAASRKRHSDLALHVH